MPEKVNSSLGSGLPPLVSDVSVPTLLAARIEGSQPDQEDSVGSWCDGLGDLREMQVHRLGGVVDLHAERLKRAARRVIAASPGRHRPFVKLLTVDRDGHALGGFVDIDQEVGVGGLAKHQHRNGGGG